MLSRSGLALAWDFWEGGGVMKTGRRIIVSLVLWAWAGVELVAGASVAKVVDYSEATVVVYNSKRNDSKEIANHYVKVRGIPKENMIALKDIPAKEVVDRTEFNATILEPIRNAFTERGWWEMGSHPEYGKVATENKIKVMVVTRGVPLKIKEDLAGSAIDPNTGKPLAPLQGKQNQASVDSELALIGAPDVELNGAQTSLYYGKDVAFEDAGLPWMVMVARLDGTSSVVVNQRVDDAIEVERRGLWGRAYIDLARKTDGGYAQGEKWLMNTANLYGQAGFLTVIDAHAPTYPPNYPMEDAALYFGWYSGAADGPFKNPDFKFAKGAVACHIHSYSAATMGRPAFWVSALVDKGASAMLGNVWEPYLGLTHHLDLFNARLLQGYTFIEAAYMSAPALSWMNIAVGDPLYRPFSPSGYPEANQEEHGDYIALRLAQSRWGKPEERGELLLNLERAAENLKSGMLYEALALQTAAGKDMAKASGALDKAYGMYEKPADKLRVRMHQADFMRSAGKKQEAVVFLRKLEKEFAGIPEVDAVKAWILILDPPPPPPPGAGARGVKGAVPVLPGKASKTLQGEAADGEKQRRKGPPERR